jgi:hypothetical protein
MSEYRYLFADLLTNQIKAELPLAGVTFGQELNTSGPFSGHLLLSGVDSYELNVSNATTPGRTAIYVDRDGTIVWAGVLWAREYSSAEQKITFTAREFESYFEHRRINFDYNLDQNPQDQLTVVQNLFNTVQGPAGSSTNIGVQIGTETSGVNVTKFYNYYDLKPLTEAVYELSKSTTGFDWNIDVSYDSSYNINKYLHLEYPRRGKIYSASSSSSLMLEFPGNIIEYTYPEDGTAATNTMYGVGAGSGAAKLISTQSDAGQLTAGWATLENSVSYTDYWDQTLLDQLTYAQLQAVKNPVTVMTVTIPTYIDPILGSYGTGDDFRIRITDDRFPTTLDVVRRLSKYDVQVGDAGAERVTMSFVVTTN